MSIKGQLTKAETNNWGFTTIWVSGTRYGADKKGTYPAQLGDIVEFEAYEKAGNDGRTWPTVKFASLRKVVGAAPQQSGASGTGQNGGSAVKSFSGTSAASRDTYWSDKEARDIAKDPQIAFQGSYDRALTFTDLAIRNGAFEALAKAKPTARLEILQAFVAEQADKIMELVYSAKVPKAASAASSDATESSDKDSGEVTAQPEEESWS